MNARMLVLAALQADKREVVIAFIEGHFFDVLRGKAATISEG